LTEVLAHEGNERDLVTVFYEVAIFLVFIRQRSSNTHSNDMMHEHDVIPLVAGNTMLFYDEVAPIRASAREDNPGERIAGPNFAVCCPRDGNIGWRLHYKPFLRLSDTVVEMQIDHCHVIAPALLVFAIRRPRKEN